MFKDMFREVPQNLGIRGALLTQLSPGVTSNEAPLSFLQLMYCSEEAALASMENFGNDAVWLFVRY